MGISQKQWDELNVILAKQLGREPTKEELEQCGYTLTGLAELCYKQFRTEQGWKRKLEENPKGFALSDSGRGCCICGGGTSPENSWYDKHGIKCLNCQRALDKKVIPVSIAKDWDRKTWFTMYDLQSKLGLKTATINKYIRDGQLKARTIKNNEGGVHFQVFLNKENTAWFKPNPS
ncbi:MAG: hypothetical protein WCI63_03150 [bacterium]